MAKDTPGGRKIIVKNRKAFHNFEIHDRLEAGIVLVGTEVKSLRDGKVQMSDAYATIQNSEVWLLNLHISEYSHASHQSHDLTRDRKLLMHKREIKKLKIKLEQRGFTLVPLSLYFKYGKVKVELGIATGKKTYDKRRDLKDKQAKRDMARATRERY